MAEYVQAWADLNDLQSMHVQPLAQGHVWDHDTSCLLQQEWW